MSVNGLLLKDDGTLAEPLSTTCSPILVTSRFRSIIGEVADSGELIMDINEVSYYFKGVRNPLVYIEELRPEELKAFREREVEDSSTKELEQARESLSNYIKALTWAHGLVKGAEVKNAEQRELLVTRLLASEGGEALVAVPKHLRQSLVIEAVKETINIPTPYIAESAEVREKE